MQSEIATLPASSKMLICQNQLIKLNLEIKLIRCFLQQIGLPNVSVLEGGFKRWMDLKFETESGPEEDIHVR